jgi:hypothetical protein
MEAPLPQQPKESLERPAAAAPPTKPTQTTAAPTPPVKSKLSSSLIGIGCFILGFILFLCTFVYFVGLFVFLILYARNKKSDPLVAQSLLYGYLSGFVLLLLAFGACFFSFTYP